MAYRGPVLVHDFVDPIVQYAGKGPRGGLQPIMLAGFGRIDRRAGRQRRSMADANDPTAHYHDYLRKGLGRLKETIQLG